MITTATRIAHHSDGYSYFNVRNQHFLHFFLFSRSHLNVEPSTARQTLGERKMRRSNVQNAILTKRLVLFRTVLLAAVISSANCAFAQNYGGIDIGSRGIKRVVIEIDNGSARVVDGSEKSENLGLAGALKPVDGNRKAFSEDSLDEAVSIIRGHVAVMRDAPFNVKRIFIAVSSGLAEAAADGAPGKTAIDELVRRIVDSGAAGDSPSIQTVTAGQEAQLTFDDVSRKAADIGGTETAHVFVIDVGSGNTKLASVERGLAINFGPTTTATELKDNPDQHPAVWQRLEAELDAELRKFSALDEKRELYVSGGTAYVVASIIDTDRIGNGPKGIHVFSPEQWRDAFELIKAADNLES
ncbi:MAG: hypothetical protein ACKV0T_08390, partial [Planctomycetales bacterium]